MPSIVHRFDWPDRFVVGTVGQPGSRTFYLQARDRKNVVSVALEKQQSAVLAERIDEVLDDLMAAEGNRYSIPAQAPDELIDNDALDQPVTEEFRVGTMSLGWDSASAQVVIEAYPIQEEDPEDSEPIETEPDEVMIVRIPVGSARAFAKRTRAVVAAGRPLCPRCEEPMDPEGHDCELPDPIL